MLAWVDFTEADLMRNIGNTNGGPKTMVDMVMVVESHGDATAIHRRYFDFVCDNPGKGKNDVPYVDAVMRTAISMGLFDGCKVLHIISDGGPKHFKNVYNMNAMSIIVHEWPRLRPGSAAPRVHWHFMAPYHGHSNCDSHAGVMKNALRRAQRDAQQAAGPGEPSKAPQTAVELTAVIEALAASTAVVLPSIPRPAQRTDLKSLSKGIKKYYEFQFTGTPGEVLCRLHTGMGEWVLQHVEEKKKAAAAAPVAAL